jgi:hypothetical protein
LIDGGDHFFSFGSSLGGGAFFNPATPFYPTKVMSSRVICASHMGQNFSTSGLESAFFMEL